MYILRDKENKIVAYAEEYALIQDAKLLTNCKDGISEYTDEEIIQNDGKFYLKSEFEEYKKTEEYKYNNEKALAQSEILRLKKELSDDDYKIIKTFEAKMLSEEAPYDVNALANERNAKRRRINELEHQFVF